MFCKKCGKVIDDDSAFCKYCGTKVFQETKRSFQYDVYTTKAGKFEKLGSLQPSTKLVVSDNNVTLFTYDKGMLHSTKTGSNYLVDSDGNIFENSIKVGYIQNYSEFRKSYGQNFSSVTNKLKDMFDLKVLGSSGFYSNIIIYRITMGILFFLILMFFIPVFRWRALEEWGLGLYFSNYEKGGDLFLSFFSLDTTIAKSYSEWDLGNGHIGLILLSILLLVIPIVLLILLIRKYPKIDLFCTIGGIANIALMFIVPGMVRSVMDPLTGMFIVELSRTVMFYFMLIANLGLTIIGLQKFFLKR